MAKRNSRDRSSWKATQEARREQQQRTQQMFSRTLFGADKRVYEAVGGFDDEIDDWETVQFASTRCARASYSPTREELHMFWTNEAKGPPYPPYVYDSVDRGAWDLLVRADSPGRWVNSYGNNYPYRPAPELL